jgi:hypothetical protein
MIRGDQDRTVGDRSALALEAMEDRDCATGQSRDDPVDSGASTGSHSHLGWMDAAQAGAQAQAQWRDLRRKT